MKRYGDAGRMTTAEEILATSNPLAWGATEPLTTPCHECGTTEGVGRTCHDGGGVLCRACFITAAEPELAAMRRARTHLAAKCEALTEPHCNWPGSGRDFDHRR